MGPANEYNARVDIEVDRPGKSHVIQSVALRARSGTPRVHAPKDLQVMDTNMSLRNYIYKTEETKQCCHYMMSLKHPINKMAYLGAKTELIAVPLS